MMELGVDAARLAVSAIRDAEMAIRLAADYCRLAELEAARLAERLGARPGGWSRGVREAVRLGARLQR